MSTENEAEVLVIGAGISGLCAAKLLHEQGIKVIVLEARDRVGGRTLTERNPDYGGYVDLGGAYIGPSQNKIIRIADELGLKTYKVNVKEKMIWHLQGDRKVFAGLFPTIWNPIKSMDLNNCVRTINQMALEVPLDAPWNAPKAKEWDSMTVKEFLDKICWTDFAKEFAANFMSKALLTVEPEELSLLYWLWYIHSGQSLDRLFATADGAQERKFYGGSMTVSEKLAERLDSKSLRLSSPVIHIDQGDDGVTVTTSGGKTYKGRYVISAVPAAISMKIRFNPPLSGLRYQLIQRMPMGSVIKTHVYYDKPYWREKDLNGSAIADFGPIVACFDDTKPDGTYPALIGFIVANKSREMCSLSAEERKEAIANHYADLFNCEALRHPTNYVEKNWMEEEFSGGCYVSALGPRVLTDFGRVLRKPVGHVYFAGTETATQWSGYMDGAVEAGERAAREVLCNMGKIGEDEIWQVEPQSTTIPEVPIGGDPMEKILPSVPTFLYTICAVLIIGIALYLSSWRV